MSRPAGREGFREFLSDLLPYQKSMMLHLLTCDRCREWVLETLLQEDGVRPWPP